MVNLSLILVSQMDRLVLNSIRKNSSKNEFTYRCFKSQIMASTQFSLVQKHGKNLVELVGM